MKKINVFFQKCCCHLLILCYSVYILFQLLSGLTGFVLDMGLKHQGKLDCKTLSVQEFELVNMIQEGQGWRSQNADPQLLYHLDGYALNLKVKMKFDATPGELDLYYTEKPGEDFDKYRRVWAVQQEDGSYLYTLPRTKIDILRLDPGSAENLGIMIEEITINTPAGIDRYFDLSLNGLFCLLLYPALAAACLQYIITLYTDVRAAHNGKGSFEQ